MKSETGLAVGETVQVRGGRPRTRRGLRARATALDCHDDRKVGHCDHFDAR